MPKNYMKKEVRRLISRVCSEVKSRFRGVIQKEDSCGRTFSAIELLHCFFPFERGRSITHMVCSDPTLCWSKLAVELLLDASFSASCNRKHCCHDEQWNHYERL